MARVYACRMTTLDRREFLKAGAAAGALGLVGLAAGEAGAAAEEPRVRRRVRLGRTGLEVPDVGFGSSRLAGEDDVVAHALARGITYFDTAESYTRGASESTLGRALRGRREQVVLATKTHCGSATTRDELMRNLEASLGRLGTDRVEIYFNHAVNDPARLRNDEWHEFVARAKQQGKLRFTGMSGHGGRLVECLDLALDEQLVDVVLVAHNFGQDPAFHEQLTRSMDLIATQPELPRVLKKARALGVGVIAMKTLRGARLNDMRPYEAGGASFAQAALRWVLASGLADALVVTMTTTAQVDEYLGASGWTRSARADHALLARYEARHGAEQCRYGCSACAGACPAGVSIPDALRARMYVEDYGDVALARAAWGESGARDACLSCAAQPCLGACPHGLAIGALTTRAAARLAG
jgi:predicted aldo/keto reductase-like oxidoreductase